MQNTAAVKERPILFSAPMVRAILEGRKTQTRRICKPWEELRANGSIDRKRLPKIILSRDVRGDWPISHNVVVSAGIHTPTSNQHGALSVQTAHGFLGIKPGEFEWLSPYGQPGDRLWVRESFWQASPYPGTLPSGEADESCRWSSRLVHYAADGNPPNCHNKHYGPDGLRGNHFAAPDPYASWLKRPSIHMPRWASRILLEVVSVRVERLNDISEADAMAEGCDDGYLVRERCQPPHSRAYRYLWESINGNGSWDANPWVWVVEFKRVQPA